MRSVSDSIILTIFTVILIYSPNMKQHQLNLFIIAFNIYRNRAHWHQNAFLIKQAIVGGKQNITHIRCQFIPSFFWEALSTKSNTFYSLLYSSLLFSQQGFLPVELPAHFWVGHLCLERTISRHLLERSNTTECSNPISALTIPSFLAPLSCQTKNYKPRQIFEFLLRLKEACCYFIWTILSSNILKCSVKSFLFKPKMQGLCCSARDGHNSHPKENPEDDYCTESDKRF